METCYAVGVSMQHSLKSHAPRQPDTSQKPQTP